LAEIVRLDRAHHRPVAGDSELAEHVKVAARAHQTMIWSRVRQGCWWPDIARVPFNPPAPYVRRGKAGMTVIAWLAEVLNQLGGPGGALVAIGHPVVGSAIDWIEATLDIGEAIATTAPARPSPSASP
jgi:hypothetical protein